ncbi:MAG: ABC transporter permease [Firmicutes bacterium]|jgi:peptide/nickel transport system permease protein|nr:ABC transporter permease [Bacillota bacterium]MDH7494424.1 ABC transporter permease [Bacillota bacterium]
MGALGDSSVWLDEVDGTDAANKSCHTLASGSAVGNARSREAGKPLASVAMGLGLALDGLSDLADLARRMAAHRSAVVGGAVILVYLAAAVFAPWLAPHAPDEVSLARRLTPPSWAGEFPFGTDQLGRDILSRVIFGARVSIMVGVLTIAISIAIGVGLGVVAGYFRGPFDRLVSRFTDLLLAFPYLIFVIGAMAMLGPGFWNLVWALSFKGWVEFYRLARAEAMSEKTKEYVDAARALGRSHAAIICSEILPNIVHSIVVLGTLRMGNMIVLESSLSFLGLGMPPRVPAWGSMVNDGRRYMLTAWWIATLPGLALVVLVLAINLVGEALRDVLDPRLKEV